jgi:DNA polymerase-1
MTCAEAIAALYAKFAEIWFGDFEFRTDPDLRPDPWCMVAREWKSGREIRMWRDELYACSCAPFDVGCNSLFVSYNVTAEMDCFLRLG